MPPAFTPSSPSFTLTSSRHSSRHSTGGMHHVIDRFARENVIADSTMLPALTRRLKAVQDFVGRVHGVLATLENLGVLTLPRNSAIILPGPSDPPGERIDRLSIRVTAAERYAQSIDDLFNELGHNMLKLSNESEREAVISAIIQCSLFSRSVPSETTFHEYCLYFRDLMANAHPNIEQDKQLCVLEMRYCDVQRQCSDIFMAFNLLQVKAERESTLSPRL
ncbi:hypothetical protein CC1G_15395 [Coprinopsis cinerea okayama7|uniref:Uncharacterized protein n=1 Tax=Coprinopsis cinerea (strain Okayama-7 / 130 / ATCC MYA-4618 / FGSC 9003) TaxID=240176 RepID=D6RQS5_COPC7|nr:hypothetical protein CC1G_15395 [Coprinopsis cinerea okayama7\|eukprot:XP_002910117.1 hypothetical protein CC1G_15395 [Coprinopsis cinerea okayama7\